LYVIFLLVIGHHGSRGEESGEEDLSMQMKYEVLPTGAGEMPEVQMDEWMNEWKNEWVSEWMNKWITGWMKKWIN